jgi:predicted phage-related endonuclease
MDIQWNTDGTVSIDPPKRPKKMTGTRFASVLGLNRWSTPFQMWCEITKAYAPPFEETKYTRAGKAIEPLQIAWMREAYALDNLIDPHDVWGSDPFGKTYGNFYTHPVFGGMWDALLVDEDWDGSVEGLAGHTEAVLEFKTTKRAEDWAEDVPEYYALQAALYAWLLGCDDVVMVASFLTDPDYDDPGSFVPSLENTAVIEFSLSERYPEFEEDYIRPALDWWAGHVETGDSPAYDEHADADWLKEMRKATLNPETDIAALIDELVGLQEKVDIVHGTVAKEEKRIKAIKDQLKKYALENIGDSPTCEFGHGPVTCKLAVSSKTTLDEKAMKADGVWEKYAKESESSRFTVTIAGK